MAKHLHTYQYNDKYFHHVILLYTHCSANRVCDTCEMILIPPKKYILSITSYLIQTSHVDTS